MRPGGWLTLDYELRVPGGSHPYFGITFDAPADQITGMRWLGRGPYRVWKNRLDGHGLRRVGQHGQRHRDGRVVGRIRSSGASSRICYWATIGTRSQPITVVAETPGLYLRMLTPTAAEGPAHDRR